MSCTDTASLAGSPAATASPANPRAEQVYQQIKALIFDFTLLPGDRFTESSIAERCGVSRTPVRDALYRLEREGYLHVGFRRGWSVRQLDFDRFDQLYAVRVVLEQAAVQVLCQQADDPAQPGHPLLRQQQTVWWVPPEQRLTDGKQVGLLDARFHHALILATGNREMARVHQEVSEKIHFIRRLDFTRHNRVAATYDEHGQILRWIATGDAAAAQAALAGHIEASRQEVRQMTLHMLHAARQRPA